MFLDTAPLPLLLLQRLIFPCFVLHLPALLRFLEEDLSRLEYVESSHINLIDIQNVYILFLTK